MKKIILFGLFLFIINSGFSQNINKKIYFLADTINVRKENRFLATKLVDVFEYSFIFYCKCIPSYKKYLEFSYLISNKIPKAEIISKKPDYNYISLKELMDIINKHGKYFNDNYELYITEVLPDDKYRTNRVKMVLFPPPSNDGVILNGKQ